MATLSDVITDVKNHLDAGLSAFWSDSELTTWINEACREIARRAEVLQRWKSYDIIANQPTYALPNDMLRIYRVEFKQSVGWIKSLEFQTFASMDDIWYWSRDVPGSIPDYYTVWGYPGGEGTALWIFPIPSSTLPDGLRVQYYGLPRPVTATTDPIDLPAGWEDLIPLYVEVVARRKEAKDMRWQEAYELFEARLQQMIEVTRQWSDQPTYIGSQSGSGAPFWLRSDWWD